MTMFILNRVLLNTLIVVIFSFCATSQIPYDARISEKEVLTPQPGLQPVINGPKIYGARPGKKFVYRIPCQGQRPITFKVEGLCKGLTLDAEKGIITGVVPAEKGEYKMRFIARNTKGQVQRDFALVVGDKLALTPPTGWNSWGGHMVAISDEIMRKTADLFENKGLADVGYQYIGIDDCWMIDVSERVNPVIQEQEKDEKYSDVDFAPLLAGGRDMKGNILPNDRFPDMKAMADYIHAYGLKVGLYSSPSELTCQKYIGSRNYENQDAEQYAKWGFDLLKYDQCGAGTAYLRAMRVKNPDYKYSEYWKPMADYLMQQDRDILYNLCQYGWEEPWKWAPELGISTWRTGGDLNHHVEEYFERALRLATDLRDFSKPGQWNDPDFMYIHKIRDYKNKTAPSVEIGLNTNQRYQYVTLWSIIAAPFFFSCDINEIDDFTISILSNATVLNINQDELGHVGEVIRNKNHEVVMMKKLADGSRAVAVFNTNDTDEAVIHIDWDEFGKCCEQTVYDVWRGKDLGVQKVGMSVKLSPNGVGFFIVKE